MRTAQELFDTVATHLLTHDRLGQDPRGLRTLFSGFFIFWAFSALISLAGSALLLYVAWHFISKFW